MIRRPTRRELLRELHAAQAREALLKRELNDARQQLAALRNANG